MSSLSDEELMSSSRLGTCTSGIDKLKQQMEMLSFSIARRTQVINKETGTCTVSIITSSNQRLGVRSLPVIIVVCY